MLAPIAGNVFSSVKARSVDFAISRQVFPISKLDAVFSIAQCWMVQAIEL
jgi:hypothetical protein